jgi:predicted nucleic acid-binding protein
MSEQLGWLDTNLFVYVLFPNDPHHSRCAALMRALQDGRTEGWIDTVVVHELTYVLSRTGLFPTRQAVHAYIRSILLTDTIHADDKDGLVDAVSRWATLGVGFADAWLAVLARRRQIPVCSVNEDDFPDTPNVFRTAEV